jgi:hypothetical protein
VDTNLNHKKQKGRPRRFASWTIEMIEVSFWRNRALTANLKHQ